MKILHTADWHIGKTLHKHPLQDQFQLFFDWLLTIIEKEAIDVILVSGDIFDLANPSTGDRRMYYKFLTQLAHLNIKIILTGGNHDSVGLLNATKELLDILDITVVGGATDDIADEIVEIKNNDCEVAVVVAAVPFLRDRDLRHRDTEEQYANRTEAIREGIRAHYAELGAICADRYPGVPAIAMGHLYAVGADRSDSERDIHVGNAAAVDTSYFPSAFDYVALGHIHRPQVLGKNPFIRYSGSPVPLSFSEKKDEKSIVILDIADNKIQAPNIIPVPKFRELKKIAGTLEEVKAQLKDYAPSYPLRSFVELEINEETHSSLTLAAVEELKFSYNEHDRFRILLSKTQFEKSTTDTADLFQAGTSIKDLAPPDVFAKRIESEQLSSDVATDLIDAFRELYELAMEGGES